MEHYGFDGRTDWWASIVKVREARQKKFDEKLTELKLYCRKNNLKY